MKIQPLQKSDLKQVSYLQPEGWSDILIDFKHYLKMPFCFPVKAEVNGKLYGVGCSMMFKNSGWLAHIIVKPEERRKGIGETLTRHLIKILRKKGIKSISLIATEDGYQLYKKNGFQTEVNYAYFEKQHPGKHYSKHSHIRQCIARDREKIYELDRIACGEDRSILMKHYLQSALVYDSSKGIEGFFVPGLSEGPIIATTKESAWTLLALKCTLSSKVVLPENNLNGMECLKDIGFIRIPKKGTRMIFGEKLPWKSNNIYNRIGGNYG